MNLNDTRSLGKITEAEFDAIHAAHCADADPWHFTPPPFAAHAATEIGHDDPAPKLRINWDGATGLFALALSAAVMCWLISLALPIF